ncbi:reverse transcriptase [Striga asiatica]|uniref:Reverse transcriptase n=1 Tax=Striga asiatica TaxID=4170 RepID=A0A5A7R5G2_STRAF|nr:reverse transcriptase [Striga asiatica]
MPSYGKFFKDLVTKKRKFEDGEKVVVYEAASAMQHDLPKVDPVATRESTTRESRVTWVAGAALSVKLARRKFRVASRAMLDAGVGRGRGLRVATWAALHHLTFWPRLNSSELGIEFRFFLCRLGLGEVRPTRMCLQLADRSIRYPLGIVEDVLVKVGKLIILVDFVVLDVGDVDENGKDHTILLGRPFMETTNTLIDVKNGTLNMTVSGESVSISVRGAMSASSVNFVEECAFIDLADPFVDEMLEKATLELKELPKHLKYVFLDDAKQKPVIIFAEDQPKTTFTCPSGTFAFRRMPFGLCNTPGTFQRCMFSIFSDMLENCL